MLDREEDVTTQYVQGGDKADNTALNSILYVVSLHTTHTYISVAGHRYRPLNNFVTYMGIF